MPAATSGCANCSRMARPQPARTMISRLILHVTLSGPARCIPVRARRSRTAAQWSAWVRGSAAAIMLSPMSATPFIECEQMHAGLAVPDVEAAATYYVEMLGFTRAFTFGEPPTFAGVNFGTVQIFLAKGTPTPSAETGTVYFVVGNADQLHEFH